MSNFIKVAFPSLNKRCDLVENDEAIRDSHNINNCKVMRSIEVSSDVYECMGEELLDDVNDSLYGRIGGSMSDDPRLEGKEWIEIINNPELREIMEETMYTLVVEVINRDSGDKFYVNTEGHAYARYVGRAV